MLGALALSGQASEWRGRGREPLPRISNTHQRLSHNAEKNLGASLDALICVHGRLEAPAAGSTSETTEQEVIGGKSTTEAAKRVAPSLARASQASLSPRVKVEGWTDTFSGLQPASECGGSATSILTPQTPRVARGSAYALGMGPRIDRWPRTNPNPAFYALPTLLQALR